MFFDVFVQAFANPQTPAGQGGALRFIPFMKTAERAAAPLVAIPACKPGSPGQLALADERRVRAIFEQSGWSGIDIQPIDVASTMPEKDPLRCLTRLGPVGRTLADIDVSTEARVAEAVRPALDPMWTEARSASLLPAGWSVTAACWMVGANA